MEQVGVNAPGTEKSATFFLEKRSEVDREEGAPSFIMPKEPVGIVSPTLMVMFADAVVENEQMKEDGLVVATLERWRNNGDKGVCSGEATSGHHVRSLCFDL